MFTVQAKSLNDADMIDRLKKKKIKQHHALLKGFSFQAFSNGSCLASYAS